MQWHCHDWAENCQKDVDSRFCEDTSSCSHRNSVIACFIRSVQPIYTLFSTSWMQQLVSSCGSANTTTSLRDDLHWLPIRQQVMYKLCTIVHKCLHAAAPPYLSELCIAVSTSAGRHFLRSATYGDLLVPRTSTSTYGPRSFAVSGPSVWNKLPATCYHRHLDSFKASWRRYFFAWPTRHDSASSWLLRLLELRLTNFPTYLLTYKEQKCVIYCFNACVDKQL